jgi:hypothetical protein
MVVVTVAAASFFWLTTRSWIWLAAIALVAGACVLLLLPWEQLLRRIWQRAS